MIKKDEIMPLNYFAYGGVYSASHRGMHYILKRNGEKPDYVLEASVWRGPYASTVVPEDEITSYKFEFTEEGRLDAIKWILEQYEYRKSYWNEAPSILEVEPVIHE